MRSHRLLRVTRPKEGEYFYIPGLAVGVVARSTRHGTLAYFFLSPEPPTPAQLAALDPERFDLCRRIGLTGFPLAKGETAPPGCGTWQLLGKLPGFDRTRWPVPAFPYQHLLSYRWVLRHYADDVGLFTHETPIAEEDALRLCRGGRLYDGQSGSGSVEAVLRKLAAGEPLHVGAPLPLAPSAHAGA
jgi:hypothetical protein